MFTHIVNRSIKRAKVGVYQEEASGHVQEKEERKVITAEEDPKNNTNPQEFNRSGPIPYRSDPIQATNLMPRSWGFVAWIGSESYGRVT